MWNIAVAIMGARRHGQVPPPLLERLQSAFCAANVYFEKMSSGSPLDPTRGLPSFRPPPAGAHGGYYNQCGRLLWRLPRCLWLILAAAAAAGLLRLRRLTVRPCWWPWPLMCFWCNLVRLLLKLPSRSRDASHFNCFTPAICTHRSTR